MLIFKYFFPKASFFEDLYALVKAGKKNRESKMMVKNAIESIISATLGFRVIKVGI